VAIGGSKVWGFLLEGGRSQVGFVGRQFGRIGGHEGVLGRAGQTGEGDPIGPGGQEALAAPGPEQ